MSTHTVVKVGGSLCADPTRLQALLASIADGAFGPCLVVPGGGAFADAVRLDQARLGFDDREAHRRALDAMSRMAADFHAIEPRLLPSPLCGGREGAGAGHTPIWDPAALRAGHPDIPESWDVTSDSLALWAATEVRASRCVLVKSADAPAGADVRDLARLGLVDAAFPDFAARFAGTIELWGPDGAVATADRIAA